MSCEQRITDGGIVPDKTKIGVVELARRDPKEPKSSRNFCLYSIQVSF